MLDVIAAFLLGIVFALLLLTLFAIIKYALDDGDTE